MVFYALFCYYNLFWFFFGRICIRRANGGAKFRKIAHETKHWSKNYLLFPEVDNCQLVHYTANHCGQSTFGKVIKLKVQDDSLLPCSDSCKIHSFRRLFWYSFTTLVRRYVYSQS